MDAITKRTITASLFILACLMLAVSNMDYEDELLSEKAYCENVAAGIYSNYKELECARWD